VSRELSTRAQPGALATIREERAVARRIRTLEGQAIERRAEDALRRELASGRMKDIKSLTKDALESGGEIADVLAEEAQARPFFARELADIASTGARGLKVELRGYVEGS
jgi:hypothetical protein